jgi:6-pyruvoyl-tetrahydropterin synthase
MKLTDEKTPSYLYSIKEGKNLFHFSSASFVIGKNFIESIHGHNFIVEIKAETNTLNSLNMVFDFTHIHGLMNKLLDTIDHRTIIPAKSPWLIITEIGDSVEFIAHKTKRYRLPKIDVVLLPIANGTVEELAQYILDQLKPKIIEMGRTSRKSTFKGKITITISEYDFQSASATAYFD